MRFSKKDVANLRCVFIHSLTKFVLEDVLKIAVLKTLIFAEKYTDGVYCKVSYSM